MSAGQREVNGISLIKVLQYRNKEGELIPLPLTEQENRGILVE